MSEAQNKIKELHNEILVAEKKKKELNSVIKEAYEKSKEYKDLMEEMKTLRARRKQLEVGIRQEYSSEFNQMEDIKTDIKDSKMVLSDLIWNELMKNNSVEVVDENDHKFVPAVVVSLKKAE
ncbi:MAG: hypothetical protein WCT18_02025 [Patescibacteria group bacterium]